MQRTLVWVLGRGGLLGSRLARAVTPGIPGADCWQCVIAKFCWQDPDRLASQLDQAVRAFAAAVQAERRSWMVLWAAGAGFVGSTGPALRAETRTWELLLELLERHLGAAAGRPPGLVFLASSAGGVYGNSPEQVLTEESPCVPISEYGQNKLRQEELLHTWASDRPQVSYLIGRISNLYGPGQNLHKPQGLISHIARLLIQHRPVHIYVPLDTVRDYFFVDDCAAYILHCLVALADKAGHPPRARRVVKILAAERPTSVAQIVGVFALVAKRHPKVICAPNALGGKQPRRLEFRSVAWPRPECVPATPLPAGIHRVYQGLLTQYCQGRLPPSEPRAP